MNTAYNNTTTATDVTTTPTQQPEPVATPEEVTTEYYGYLDGRDPMQIGRIKKQLDRRIYVDDKTCTWAEYIAEGYEAGQLKAYKDEYTYDKKGRDLAYHEHKVTEWVIWTAREMERGNGVLANKTIVDYALYLIKLMEEATPATAPQATEEDTTTVPEATAETPVQEPEEVTTEEDATTAPATDDATLLRDVMEQYGNVGADYLDTLDYNQATKQEPRTVMFGRAKVTERRYTLPEPNQYGYLSTHGLARYHNRNGKRAEFVVYQYGEAIELRAYGRNNNTYNAEVRFDGGTLTYNVTDGLVTRAELIRDGNTISVEFDDTNRPETPRDLPAPAPTKTTSKETTAKEETATTEEEQPTSKPATAPTTEEVTHPEEVQDVTTSKPAKEEPAPYWLLLDNELRAQQEEQEQAPATTEEPEAPDNEETDDPEEVKETEEVVFLKGAELEKAIDEHIKKTEHLSERLDLKFYKSRYYYYITADGYIVKLDKSKPKKVLYIPDEGPFYESYAKGDVTDRDIFFAKNMKTLDKYMRERLETPVLCSIRRTMEGNLSIDPFGRTEYSYDPATGKSEELPIKRPTPRELAIYVAAWDAYEADQRARLEKYWKRYGDKVRVDTYWANR